MNAVLFSFHNLFMNFLGVGNIFLFRITEKSYRIAKKPETSDCPKLYTNQRTENQLFWPMPEPALCPKYQTVTDS